MFIEVTGSLISKFNTSLALFVPETKRVDIVLGTVL